MDRLVGPIDHCLSLERFPSLIYICTSIYCALNGEYNLSHSRRLLKKRGRKLTIWNKTHPLDHPVLLPSGQHRPYVPVPAELVHQPVNHVTIDNA